MLSELYSKTKKEVSNIANIYFTNDQWDWFYEAAVEKRLHDLNRAEGFLIKSYVHKFRADALLKQTEQEYLQCANIN